MPLVGVDLLQRQADRLSAASLSLSREDFVISLVEVRRENWSSGAGIAQYG